MSYVQAMKHCTSHRKDRFYQQCSGDIYSSKEWAYCVIDTITKERLSEDFKTQKEADSAYWKLFLQNLTHPIKVVDVCNGRPIIYND